MKDMQHIGVHKRLGGWMLVGLDARGRGKEGQIAMAEEGRKSFIGCAEGDYLGKEEHNQNTCKRERSA